MYVSPVCTQLHACTGFGHGTPHVCTQKTRTPSQPTPLFRPDPSPPKQKELHCHPHPSPPTPTAHVHDCLLLGAGLLQCSPPQHHHNPAAQTNQTSPPPPCTPTSTATQHTHLDDCLLLGAGLLQCCAHDPAALGVLNVSAHLANDCRVAVAVKVVVLYLWVCEKGGGDVWVGVLGGGQVARCVGVVAGVVPCSSRPVSILARGAGKGGFR